MEIFFWSEPVGLGLFLISVGLFLFLLSLANKNNRK